MWVEVTAQQEAVFTQWGPEQCVWTQVILLDTSDTASPHSNCDQSCAATPVRVQNMTLSTCSDPSEMKVWATPPGRPPTHGKVIAGATMNVQRTREGGTRG